MYKSLVLRNPSRVFDPRFSRTNYAVSNPRAYSSEVAKVEDYETRLYYEYKKCVDAGGQDFFYTLTYNDAALPRFYGVPCFNYDDLRTITNGALKKKLLREYGIDLKYFISSERGEGAGKRGYGKNPHYHVHFFLYPHVGKPVVRRVKVIDHLKSKGPNKGRPVYRYEKVEVKHRKISPFAFRDLVREAWQGTTLSFAASDPRKFKYGIAQEGDNCGEVFNYRAAVYCAKYVCKSLSDRKIDAKVHDRIRHAFNRACRDSVDFHLSFCMALFQPVEFRECLWKYIEQYDDSLARPDYDDIPDFDSLPAGFWKAYCGWLARRYPVEYQSFCLSYFDKNYMPEYVKYLNHYSLRVRSSNGLGISALNSVVSDIDGDRVLFPTKTGFKMRNIGSYLYRKLYYSYDKSLVSSREVDLGPDYTDFESYDFETGEVVSRSQFVPQFGNVFYYLNQDGVNMLSHRILRKIERVSETMNKAVHLCTTSLSSSFVCKYPQFENYDVYNFLDEKFYEKCASYVLVYQGRFYSGFAQPVAPPAIDYESDYRGFLQNPHFSLEFDGESYRLPAPLDSATYIPYSDHPYFRNIVGCIDFVTCAVDFVSELSDEKRRAESLERKRIKAFHDSNRFPY